MTTPRLRLAALSAVGTALAVAIAAPAAAHAAEDTTISASVESTISLAVAGFTAPTLRPTASAVALGSGVVTATVSTNSITGYSLSLTSKDAQTNLASSGGTTIAASTGTSVAPTALAANTWGYRVNGGAFGDGTAAPDALTYAGVPAVGTANVIKNRAGTAAADTTGVQFGVAVDATKATGTYSKIVTLTAVAN